MNIDAEGLSQATLIDLELRYGSDICKRGFTLLPVSLLTQYVRLGLTPSELVVTLNLLRHWSALGLLPTVANQTLATSIGMIPRTINWYTTRLVKIGLVERIEQPCKANLYDFSSLLKELSQLGRNQVPSNFLPDETILEMARGRYGDKLCFYGLAMLPNALLDHQGNLGISSSELLLAIYLCLLWQEPSSHPHPQMQHLSEMMGFEKRTVRGLVTRMVHKGLIERHIKHQATNTYVLRSLFTKIQTFINVEPVELEVVLRVDKRKNKSNTKKISFDKAMTLEDFAKPLNLRAQTECSLPPTNPTTSRARPKPSLWLTLLSSENIVGTK